MVFRSRIDFWLLILLLSLSGFLIFHVCSSLIQQAINAETIVTLLIVTAVIYVLWLPIQRTRYCFNDHALKVESLGVDLSIPYACIQNIKPCVSLMAAPALSIQRLEITFQTHHLKETVHISPKYPQQFCEELTKRMTAQDQASSYALKVSL